MSQRVSTPTIDVPGLQTMLERGEPLTVLDVRSAAERAEWAIPGSLHIDAYDRLKAGDQHALDGLELPEDVPVVTICAAGRTSLIAAELLRERGFDALSLAGGMKAWSMAWNTAEIAVPGSAARVVQVRRTGKGCLSYIVGSDGEAAVIDASIDPSAYVALAAERGWRITAVLDTHIHADHVSRARALADRTGATLYMPAQGRVAYPHTPLIEGDAPRVGDAQLRVLRVPGHTRESSCYLLDGAALFTGDTIFLAAVGRPDLEASAEEARQRARLLHGSLARLLALPDDTLVLPGHTSEPAPFDGVAIVATLSAVRKRVALLRESEEGFVVSILARIPPAPPNHQRIVALNEAGQLPSDGLTDLEAGANRCAVA